ncbi:MAG: LysR family transcriptional regulator [Pseudomonadota bacterium]
MDLRFLRTFRTAATLLNFNRTAEVLHYAQSTVSAQIKALEDEVGVGLFERIGKKVVLTEAGAALLEYAHKLIALEEEALGAAAGREGPAGRISLRVPQTISTYHLPGILAEYFARFPGVNFDVSSCALFSLERELDIGAIDLAFLLADYVNSASLEIELLGTEPLLFVSKPGGPLTSSPEVRYEDLRGAALFLPKADCGYRMALERTLAEKRVEPSNIMDFNSLEAIKECVRAGLGVAVVPRIAVLDDLQRGLLVALPWEEDLETAIIMIRRRGKWMSPSLAGFVETVRAWFRSH